MPKPSRQYLAHPAYHALPAPFIFRATFLPVESEYPVHEHNWGEFVYSYSGVMEIKLAEHHYLSPPQYGIWLPPGISHVGLNRYETAICSLYITREKCASMPADPCALTVSPLVRAILEHLRLNPPGENMTETEERLFQVLADQLSQAPRAGSYLPTSEDPLLSQVLHLLEANPADNRSLRELARKINSTERTLIRRCQKELGMTFNEWRQRLRIVRALPLLEAGKTVESIALDLGYSSASAFIAMFRRLMGSTPAEFRKGIV